MLLLMNTKNYNSYLIKHVEKVASLLYSVAHGLHLFRCNSTVTLLYASVCMLHCVEDQV